MEEISEDELEQVKRNIQDMWKNPELRNTVRLSQLALLRELSLKGFTIVKL